MSTYSHVFKTRPARVFGMTVVVVTGVLVGLFLAFCFVATVLDRLG